MTLTDLATRFDGWHFYFSSADRVWAVSVTPGDACGSGQTWDADTPEAMAEFLAAKAGEQR